ncbi:hypothetical protein D3C85_1395430 [compost metagenome]
MQRTPTVIRERSFMPDGINGDMASQGVRRSARGGSMAMEGWPGRAASCSCKKVCAAMTIASGAWVAAICAWAAAVEASSRAVRQPARARRCRAEIFMMDEL